MLSPYAACFLLILLLPPAVTFYHPPAPSDAKYQCFLRCSGLTPTDFAVEKQMEEGDNIMRTEMVTLLRKHGVHLL